MSLDADAQRRALDLLDALLDVAPEAQAAWLDAQRDVPDHVRAEARALLAAHVAAGPLDRPLVLEAPPELRTRLAHALAGRYTIEEELGRGGTATVFLAHEAKHDRRVVLKVLDPAVAALFGPERFLREVRIAAQLAHPNIVPLIDSGNADGLLYYVMPFVQGEVLRRRLRRSGRLAPIEAMPLLRDVADALQQAHASGVVHRDLKPENVLVADGRAFLLDFGIAKLIGDDESHDTLTAPGHAVGTRRYMAPEQAAGWEQMDQRVDVFAFGILAHELLLGRPPEAGRPAAMITQELRPIAGDALAQLVTECLAGVPDDRPADMQAVARRLADVTVPSGVRPERARGLRLGAIAAALVTAGVLLAVVASRRAAPRASSADGLAQPVAVAVFRNETGDTAFTSLGRLAGDWITEGLQRTGRVQVVPWGAALRADADAAADVVAAMRRETGAGTIVTGHIYAVGDSLQFRAQISDGATGRLLATPTPLTVPRAAAHDALSSLRERVMGSVAALTDERVAAVPGFVQRPPSYEAYRRFDRGLTRFLDQQYDSAATDFREAWQRDTAFATALVYAAKAAWNAGATATADTLAQEARRREAALAEYHELWLRFIEAVLQGDDGRALQAMEQARQLAPRSRAGFDYAVVALEMARPREALAALQALDPERGELRGWSSYWTQLAHAQHLVGDHVGELGSARQQQRRHPDRRVALVLEARALAALGRTTALDSALAVWRALPPDVYWSVGGALVTAGEELLSRGRDAEALRYFDEAVRWLGNRLIAVPGDRGHRYWIGNALYASGRYEDARPYFEELAREFPERIRYRGLAAVAAARAGDWPAAERWLGLMPQFGRGEHTAFRARLAAIAGDRERAFELMATALAQGVDGLAWLHGLAARDFAPLRGDPRYRTVLGLVGDSH